MSQGFSGYPASPLTVYPESQYGYNMGTGLDDQQDQQEEMDNKKMGWYAQTAMYSDDHDALPPTNKLNTIEDYEALMTKIMNLEEITKESEEKINEIEVKWNKDN